jgi:hypothetical protein
MMEFKNKTFFLIAKSFACFCELRHVIEFILNFEAYNTKLFF